VIHPNILPLFVTISAEVHASEYFTYFQVASSLNKKSKSKPSNTRGLLDISLPHGPGVCGAGRGDVVGTVPAVVKFASCNDLCRASTFNQGRAVSFSGPVEPWQRREFKCHLQEHTTNKQNQVSANN